MKANRSLFLLVGLCIIILFGSCNKEKDNNPVAPTNKFVGKWKSEVPLLVKIKTDFCTNTMEDVATMMWDVNWEVTETNDPNIMDIKMNYTSSDFTIVNSACTFGAGYAPEPQPMYMKGYVTDNTLSVEYLGEEIFLLNYSTMKVLKGELSYSYCYVYCQEIYTNPDGFSITYY